MENNSSTNTGLSLPSIGTLFSESWQTFTKSLLSLFLLNILGIAIYIVLGIAAVLVFVLSGAGSFLLKNGLQGITTSLPNLTFSTITTISIIALVFGIIYLLVNSALQIASIILVSSPGKTSTWLAFKKSFGLIIPLSLVGILTFILTVGSLFVFILPLILFYFLLVFVQLEVVLNNQRSLEAIKRSVLLVSKHFGAIAVRLILLTLIYLGYSIFTSLLGKISPETKALVNIVSFIINLFIGWFSLSFMITLYKQASLGLENQKGSSIAWMWVIALLGWLIAVGLGFATYKTISSGILNEVFKKSATNTPGISIQRSITDMQPAAKDHYDKSQELFKQMQTVSNNPTAIKPIADQTIQEAKLATNAQPDNPLLWSNLGDAYGWPSTVGTAEDSLNAYKKAEELAPNNIVYINYVGDQLIRLGRNEDAILQFQKTLRITDKSGYANLSIAGAYANLKIYDSARENYQKAIEIFTQENNDGSYDDEILQAKKEMATLPK